MKKKLFLCAAAITSLVAQDNNGIPPSSNDVVREFIEETLLEHSYMQQAMNHIAAASAMQQNKRFPGEKEFLDTYQKCVHDETWLSRFMDVYAKRFSAEEIASMLEYRRSEVAKKETDFAMEIGTEIMQLNYEIIGNIVAQYTNEEPVADVKSSLLQVLNSENFLQEIQNSEIPIVVKIYSNRCPPCKIMAPTFESLAAEYKGVYRFATLNVDDAGDLIKKYGITSIPTILFMKDGEVIERYIGLLSREDLQESIENLLGNH